ncbi:ATP-binding cassette domain-containing protein [Hungatella sp.]|uniref:ATP-binding cassette domain-containing protein n=1 Tax=Hungatella sp. TaxID=2613924 RepID=UPI0039A33FAC
MTMKGSKMNLSFGSEIIYEDAEFLINDHDKAGIVGVNGAGKTTLFHVLMHELELDSGTISTGNSRIACLPQEIVIHDETCTVLDYLQEGRPIRRLEADLSRIYQRLEHAAVTEHASLLKQMDKLQTRLEFFDCYKADSILLDIIDRMQIDIDLLDMPVNRLSGGQKSKIAFARVLYSKADILLLDEPTNHLDAAAKEFVTEFLKNYRGMGLSATIPPSSIRLFTKSCSSIKLRTKFLSTTAITILIKRSMQRSSVCVNGFSSRRKKR